jgi:hypothetical protein
MRQVFPGHAVGRIDLHGPPEQFRGPLRPATFRRGRAEVIQGFFVLSRQGDGPLERFPPGLPVLPLEMIGMWLLYIP